MFYHKGFNMKNQNSNDSEDNYFFIKDIKKERFFVDLRKLFTDYGLTVTESETIIDRIKRYLDKIQK